MRPRTNNLIYFRRPSAARTGSQQSRSTEVVLSIFLYDYFRHYVAAVQHNAIGIFVTLTLRLKNCVENENTNRVVLNRPAHEYSDVRRI